MQHGNVGVNTWLCVTDRGGEHMLEWRWKRAEQGQEWPGTGESSDDRSSAQILMSLGGVAMEKLAFESILLFIVRSTCYGRSQTTYGKKACQAVVIFPTI